MVIRGTTAQRPWLLAGCSLVMVFGGLFLLKVSVFDVLAAARRHDPSVSLGNGSLVAPIFIVLGLLTLTSSVAPQALDRGPVARLMSNPKTGRLSLRGTIVLFGLVGVGLALHLWLRSELQGLGYAG
jgi:hypothetical protein